MLHHGPTFVALIRDFKNLCVVITCAAAINNLLPRSGWVAKFISRKHIWIYNMIVDVVAIAGLNWRIRVPSWDREFLGFRKRMRHTYRNFTQDVVDRKTK